MKSIGKVLAGTFLLAFVAACGSSVSFDGSAVDVSRSLDVVGTAQICGEESVDLMAGQTIDIGSVVFSNDETTLYVSYQLTDGWKLKETHVQVGCSLSDFSLTKTGNPQVGRFQYAMTFDPYADSYTLAIPFADIACFNECGDTLLIGAHAAVVKLDGDGNVIQAETAWGSGPPFPGKNWFTYSTYTTACCEEPPGDNCTLTIGYWKTHAGFGPQADEVTPLLPQLLGSEGGDKTQTVDTAELAVQFLSFYGSNNAFDASNGINKLYAQMLAAKLNVAHGADDSAIATALGDADPFLAIYDSTDWDNPDIDQQEVLGWAATLDDYNNGDIGPGHCD